MFWNFFKKPKKLQQEPQDSECHTWICYGIDNQGISIDINIENFSEKSLTDFAKLLAGVSTMALVPDTIAVLRDGLESDDNSYAFVITKAIEYAKVEMEKILQESHDLEDLQSNSDEPVVKPSDIFK